MCCDPWLTGKFTSMHFHWFYMVSILWAYYTVQGQQKAEGIRLEKLNMKKMLI